MNIAIVDNLSSDLDHLKEILHSYAALHHLQFNIRHFPSAEALLDVYQPLLFSILFLEINLGSLTGTETARQIRVHDEDVPIIFVTASSEYRAEAFDCFAAGYLTKPIAREKIYRVLDHILHSKKSQDHQFCFVSDRHAQSLPYSQILSLHSDKNYVILTDLSGKTYKIRMLFSEAENLVRNDERFLTVSRGVIVNLDHVLSITREVCQLKQEIRYPVNIRKSHQIREMWFNKKKKKKGISSTAELSSF